VHAADTDLTPVDLGSYSSRVSLMCGLAAIQAADRLRAAARWHRSVSPHVEASHISLRAFTSPQTRASSGTPMHSETSPVRVVSANACIAEK